MHLVMHRNIYIPALLTLALCFGQIVASIHAVGHLQAHESRDIATGFDSSTSDSTSFDNLVEARLTGTDTHGDRFHSNQPHDENTHASNVHDERSHALLSNNQPANHQHAEHVDDERTHETENDCSLYHVLLGFSGVACRSTSEFDIARQSTPGDFYVSPAQFSTQANQTGIRAPPTYS